MSNDLIAKITKAGEFLQQGKINKEQYNALVSKLIAADEKQTPAQQSLTPPQEKIYIPPASEKAGKSKTKGGAGCFLAVITGLFFIYIIGSSETTKPTNSNLQVNKPANARITENEEKHRLLRVKTLSNYIANKDYEAAGKIYKSVEYTLLPAERATLASKLSKEILLISSNQIKQNLNGYKLLNKLKPNSEHAQKEKLYKNKFKERALKNMRKTTDKIRNTSFYRHIQAPKYNNSFTAIFPYIAEKDFNHWLRMKVQYTGENWLFVENVIAFYDGVSTPIITGNFQRDHSGGKIWEWADVAPTKQQLSTLRNLANAKEAIIRFEGKQYYSDKKLSKAQKQMIITSLDAFQALQDK